LLRRFIAHFLPKLIDELLDIDLGQKVFDGLSTHFRDELVRVIPGKLAKTLVRKQILLFEIRHFAFIDDYIGFEVQDLFKVAQSYIDQMPITGRQSIKKQKEL